MNRVRKHPSNNVRRLAKQLVKLRSDSEHSLLKIQHHSWFLIHSTLYLCRKWKETVDEWVKFNQPGDLEPPSLIGKRENKLWISEQASFCFNLRPINLFIVADEDSPVQKALHNGNRQQVETETPFFRFLLSHWASIIILFFCGRFLISDTHRFLRVSYWTIILWIFLHFNA